MMGLLGNDWNDPRTMASLQLAAGLLASGGPSRQPTNIGMGLLTGLQGYENTMALSNRQKLLEEEMELRRQDAAQRQQEAAMKLSELQRDQSERAARAQQVEELVRTVPEELKPWARLFPEEAFKMLTRQGADPKRYVVGGNLVDESGKPLFTAPQTEKESPIRQALKDAGVDPDSQQGRMMAMQYAQKLATHQPPTTQITVGQPVPVINPTTGQVEFAQFGNRPGAPPQLTGLRPATEAKPLTAEERLASGYAMRMQEASKILDPLEKTGVPSIATEAAGAVPMIGGYAQRLLETKDQQLFRQAQEDWVRAKLRKESGAVIAKDEMDREIETYFPKPGDRPEVIAQKRDARKTAEQAMGMSAGAGIGKTQNAQPDGWRSAGYSSKSAAIADAIRTVAANPTSKQEVIRRLEAMGITDHGLR